MVHATRWREKGRFQIGPSRGDRTFNLSGSAVFFHADNSASVVEVPASVVPVDSSWALVTLAFLLAIAGVHQTRARKY